MTQDPEKSLWRLTVSEGISVCAAILDDDLGPPGHGPEEAASIMAGSLLELLKVGRPEAVREQLQNLPPGQRKDIVRAVPASGCPAPETLEEFRVFVADPILHAPSRPHAAAGTRRPRPRKPHRR